MTRVPVVALSATIADVDGRPRLKLDAAYLDALVGAGLAPLVVPPLADTGAVERLLEAVQGLVLTGGEDVAPARYGAAPHPALGETHAARDATELAIVRAARARRLPTLAICRGVQLLNVAMGGTLVQDIPSERPGALAHDPRAPRAERTHAVRVEPGSRLAAALGATRLAVNSLHHQAVDRPGEGLRVVARAEDGVIEGVESDDAWWALGVQWHPEELVRTAEPWDRELFAAFARAIRSRESGGRSQE